MNHALIGLAALAIAAAALPASAQQLPACSGALCSASGLSTQALAEAAREASPRPAAVSAGEPAARNAWDLHMPARAEDYSCALSFGVGGELGKGGFLGARALAQTRVLRDPSAK
jgi:hypothetical protein